MATATAETLGRRIARLRLEHGMTQERLADLMNVSAQAVSKWENNQSYPDIMLLPELSRVFGVTVDELLGVAVPAAEPAPDPEPAPTPAPDHDPEPASEPEPEPEPEPELATESEPYRYSATPLGDALRAAREAAENPTPEPEAPAEEPQTEADYARATKLRIHVIGAKGDMVNLTIPLGVTRFLANIAAFIPADALDGVDLPGIIGAITDTAPGTLVDVYDENADERVLITLE